MGSFINYEEIEGLWIRPKNPIRRIGHCVLLHSGRLWPCFQNKKIPKTLPSTNALAYIIQRRRAYLLWHIYDTCGLYYKPMTIVNDNSRVIHKLETSLTDDARVIIYDCHMFIVQATIMISFLIKALNPQKCEKSLYDILCSGLVTPVQTTLARNPNCQHCPRCTRTLNALFRLLRKGSVLATPLL